MRQFWRGSMRHPQDTLLIPNRRVSSWGPGCRCEAANVGVEWRLSAPSRALIEAAAGSRPMRARARTGTVVSEPMRPAPGSVHAFPAPPPGASKRCEARMRACAGPRHKLALPWRQRNKDLGRQGLLTENEEREN